MPSKRLSPNRTLRPREQVSTQVMTAVTVSAGVRKPNDVNRKTGVETSDRRRWQRNHHGNEVGRRLGGDGQQREDWGRPHSTLACQGETLASSLLLIDDVSCCGALLVVLITSADRGRAQHTWHLRSIVLIPLREQNAEHFGPTLRPYKDG